MSEVDERPLADRMRPAILDDIAGQQHLLGERKPLRRALHAGHLHSMILWGPPGCGKTTLARLVASHSRQQFLAISAVMGGVKDIREAVEKAQQHRTEAQQGTVLFIDEVHRFNKSQQDALLPYVEDGSLLLIGATTENPSFELNNALLSRARVYVLKGLDCQALVSLLERALQDTDRGLGTLGLNCDTALLQQLAMAADADARRALNLLELAVEMAMARSQTASQLEQEDIAAVLEGSVRRFDKGGEYFYDQISALHKSVRGSDPDAALYWFARMIDGGCDPRYIARRVVRMAAEDIGLADPRGQALALQGWEIYERLGSPEGELAIAQAIVYLASTAKSNAVYTAYHAAMADVRSTGSLDVPLHLRNAPTRLMKDLGYGKDYRYAHDEPGGVAVGETYFPEGLADRRYYEPVDRGLEMKIRDKLQRLRAGNRQAAGTKHD